MELLAAGGPEGTNVAELGIGTNEKAILTGELLEDEKILGTCHVAFGASAAIGGTVQVPVHLDCVVMRPERRDRRPGRGPRRRAARSERGAHCSRSRTSPRVATRELIAAITAAFERARELLDSPHRPGPQPHRAHARRAAAAIWPRRSPAGRVACVERIDMLDPRRRPPADRRARRLPARLARPTRERERGARRGARDRRGDRGARGPGVPLRRARVGARARASARTFAAAGRRSCARRMRAGELAPDLGPRQPAPTRRRDAGHRPAAAGGVQPRARHRRARDRGRDRGRAARVRGRARRGAGDRRSISTGAPRSRPTSTTRSPCRSRAVIERVRELAAERGARPVAAARSSAWSRRRRSAGCPDDLPLGGFDPDAQVIERRLDAERSVSLCRRWLRRGSDAAASTAARRAASIDRRGPRGRPRTREEARRGRSARRRQARRPARRRADLAQRVQARRARRGRSSSLLAAACSSSRSARRSALSVCMMAIYVPLGYYVDRFFYRRRLRQAAGSAPRRAPADRGYPRRMDVRSFTVGPVAENCYVLRRDGSDRGLIVDPGEEAERILRRVDELGIGDRRDPAHPHPLRPHRRGRAGGAGDRGARSTAPRSRSRCSPTS